MTQILNLLRPLEILGFGIVPNFGFGASNLPSSGCRMKPYAVLAGKNRLKDAALGRKLLNRPDAIQQWRVGIIQDHVKGMGRQVGEVVGGKFLKRIR
jgi:hypothetical protein